MSEIISPIPPINPSQETVIHTTWYYDPNKAPVVFNMEAISDYGNIIEEIDESNNNLIKRFTRREPLINIGAKIRVHAHNPEGKDFDGLKGRVVFYIDNVSTGYADGVTVYNANPGNHTIKVTFNGIELTQEVVIIGTETIQEITFTFTRTSYNIYSLLSASLNFTAPTLSLPDPVENGAYVINTMPHTSGLGTYNSVTDRYIFGGLSGPDNVDFFFHGKSNVIGNPLTASGSVNINVNSSGIQVSASIAWGGAIGEYTLTAGWCTFWIGGGAAMFNPNFDNWIVQAKAGSGGSGIAAFTVGTASVYGTAKIIVVTAAHSGTYMDNVSGGASYEANDSQPGSSYSRNHLFRTGAVCSSIPYFDEDLP